MDSSSIGERGPCSAPHDALFGAANQVQEEVQNGNILEQQLAREELTQVACVLHPEVLLTTQELGKKRAKKGQKVPAARIRELLQRENPRVVVLEGPAGIGKSSVL